MPTYFQRPENALKRANEFIDVGKKQRALDALYDVIKSKKHRTWQKIHEPIMEKYLGLCVDLRKSHTAKEGLYQYKNICQQVNINSLVDVVRRYIALAEEKTEEARQESHQTVVDVDDLEMPDTPESMLLKAVSGEDTQDRTDRAILTPWVKFLWESYRQCLDLLRNNSRVERLYQDIAQQAFKFCLKYTRKTEFRKLCDNLRTHLGHIHKHQHQQTAINLNNPESQNMHLETRLVQLDSAISMELWQEAFKAVEDIHGLINLSKKPPKPSLMANYYQKLGLVFWKSGNPLFHACTLHRLYQLSREQRKNLSQDELLKMASRVLCATLAVPIPPSRNAIDSILEVDESTQEKKRRLSTLLMLQNPPTRQGLIKDLVKFNLIQYVVPELNNLFQWLEVEFHPLKLASRIAPSIEYIEQNEDLAQYVPALEDIIITRVLKQVSQVYQTIQFSRLASLLPFASKFRLERVIVDSARTLELQVRIDHRAEALTFGTSLVVAQREDLNEGPYIQSMPSEQIRNQLTAMSQALRKAVACLQPKGPATNSELKEHIISNYRMTAKKEHQRILMRRQIIEDRKEQLEHMTVQKEKEEYEQQEEQRRKAYEAELARLDREREERERQRQQEETEMIRKRHAKERLAELKKSELGARVFKNLDEEELEELDVDDIMAKQVEQLEKEKKELMERLKAQEKKVDYFARARRLEEVPLLQKEHEENSIKAREFWEQQELERIETLKKEREIALANRDRLSRMWTDKEEFLNQLKDARQSVYKDKLKEFEKKLAEERKRRLLDRKERRKEERRMKWIKEKEEIEQRRKDEEMKREREEKERLERELREKEEAEYHERLAKLEEQAAKQREREREIEEREARRVEEEMKAREKPSRELESADGERSWRAPAEKDTSWRRGPGPEEPSEHRAWKPSIREGGWRDREREREASWRSNRDDGPREFRRDDGGGRDFRRDDRDFRREDGGGRDFRRDDRDFRRDDGGGRDFSRRDDGGGRDFRRDDRDFRRDDREFRRDDRDTGDWRRGGPPRDEPDRFQREEHRWRDRGGPRDEDRSWRRDEPHGRWGDRDRGPPRGPPRDDDRDWRSRGPPQDDDRGPPMRGGPRDDDRGPPRGPPRDDRGPPARRDFGRDDRDWRDRGPPREERSFRGMPRDVRLDDPPPRSSPRGMPRDVRLDEDRAPAMRGMPRDVRLDDPPPRQSPRGMPRDVRLDEPEGPWRRGGEGSSPSKGGWRDSDRGGDEPPRGPPPRSNRPPEGEPGDDGWTTVKY